MYDRILVAIDPTPPEENWSALQQTEQIGKFDNEWFERARIRGLIAVRFAGRERDCPADLSSDEEREDQRRLEPVFEELLMIQEPALRRREIVIDTGLSMTNRPARCRTV